MAKRTRKRYTEEQKKSILAAAQKDSLTAGQVQQKFGVKPITYYSWRKKTGVAGRRGRPAGSGRGPGRPRGSGRGAGGSGIEVMVRDEVRSRVQTMLPDIIRTEVNNYVAAMLGGGGVRRRGRRPGRPRKKK